MNCILDKKITLLITVLTANAILQAQALREVPYTSELTQFINSYFNHKIESQDELEKLFIEAMDSAAKLDSDYSKTVHQGRCIYYYGMQLMEDYDISEMSNRNLEDTSETKNSNQKAADCFDSAIELGKKALKIKKGSDACSLIAGGISANCTAKNTSYILNNGLKVGKYAKKAFTLDETNGTAYFLNTCQSVYAPVPFCKIREGRSQMLNYLENEHINKEQFDRFNFLYSIAYSHYRKKEFNEALYWFEKAKQIYPDNLAVNRTINKILADNN